MKKVYLSGPITGLTYAEGQDWREMVKADLASSASIEGLSPLRAKEYLDKHGILEGEYTEFPLSSKEGITCRDRWDTTRADVVLVNVLGAKSPSLGTVMEIGWADLARKPIVLVMEATGNPHDHPMVRATAGFIVHDLWDAVKIVKALLRS